MEYKTDVAMSEAAAADPKRMKDHLGNIQVIYNEFLANQHLLKNVKTSLDGLLRTYANQLGPSDVKNLEKPVEALETRYERLSKILAEKCHELDNALVHCQGVQDALINLISWLNSAEVHYK